MRWRLCSLLLLTSLVSNAQIGDTTKFHDQFAQAVQLSNLHKMFVALDNNLSCVFHENATMDNCNRYVRHCEWYFSEYKECDNDYAKKHNDECAARPFEKYMAEQFLSTALTERAMIKYDLGDNYGCRLDLQKSNELRPEDTYTLILLGSINIQFGDKENGCLQLSKAGELGNNKAYGIIKSYCH